MNKRTGAAILAAATAATLTLPAASAWAAPKDDAAAKKVYVCKYVGKPGVDERLKGGKNPIAVSVNAVAKDGSEVKIGSKFADGQGTSVVIGFVEKGKPAPTLSDCPAPSKPETPKPETPKPETPAPKPETPKPSEPAKPSPKPSDKVTPKPSTPAKPAPKPSAKETPKSEDRGVAAKTGADAGLNPLALAGLGVVGAAVSGGVAMAARRRG